MTIAEECEGQLVVQAVHCYCAVITFFFFASDMIEEVLEGRAGLPPVNANGVNTEPCSTPTSHLRLTSTNMEDSVPSTCLYSE